MRRVLFVVAMVGLLLASACRDSEEPAGAPGKSVIVRSGTSFGMCAGYCWSELEASGTKGVFVRRAWRQVLPDDRRDLAIDPKAWAAILESIDADALRALPDRIGCPDCADGGAEWIEIQSPDLNRKVTFEAGAPIPSIQPLLDAVRAVRPAGAESH